MSAPTVGGTAGVPLLPQRRRLGTGAAGGLFPRVGLLLGQHQQVRSVLFAPPTSILTVQMILVANF